MNPDRPPRRAAKALTLAALTAVAALATGCSMTDPMSTFDAKGPLAKQQLYLFWVTVVVTGFLFITVGGALLWALIRYRERPGDADKPMPPQGHGHPLIEIGLITGSIICLVIIAVPTLQGIWLMEEIPDYVDDEEVIDVTVRGWQWWFSFDYDTPQGKFTTANELTVPAGKVVRLKLLSDNVIHSFWIPKIAGKVDLVPGRINTMWILAGEHLATATSTEDAARIVRVNEEVRGHYYGQCAEFCGEAHAYMLFRCEVVSDEDYAAWVDRQLSESTPPAGVPWASFEEARLAYPAAAKDQPGLSLRDHFDARFPGKTERELEVLQGASLFNTGGCVQCHRINFEGGPGGKKDAPDLAHFGSRKSVAAGILDNRKDWEGDIDDETQYQSILSWISNSARHKPGNLMYPTLLKNPADRTRPADELDDAYKLTQAEFSHIARFLQTLK